MWHVVAHNVFNRDKPHANNFEQQKVKECYHQKQKKSSVVPQAYALINDCTMMVESVDTSVAELAVRSIGRPNNVTSFTLPISVDLAFSEHYIVFIITVRS